MQSVCVFVSIEQLPINQETASAYLHWYVLLREISDLRPDQESIGDTR